VKGIGRWTAQMFLMFRLGRPNVLPELDLGIQNGVRRAYGLRTRPKPKDILRIGERWAPHSSVASWYLWRVLELPAWGNATKKKRGKKKAAAKRRAITKKRATPRKRATAKKRRASK
jgi:3-methyladenine DNA glycosylase/8-oxoguanine DNA glycosylase